MCEIEAHPIIFSDLCTSIRERQVFGRRTSEISGTRRRKRRWRALTPRVDGVATQDDAVDAVDASRTTFYSKMTLTPDLFVTTRNTTLATSGLQFHVPDIISQDAVTSSLSTRRSPRLYSLPMRYLSMAGHVERSTFISFFLQRLKAAVHGPEVDIRQCSHLILLLSVVPFNNWFVAWEESF